MVYGVWSNAGVTCSGMLFLEVSMIFCPEAHPVKRTHNKKSIRITCSLH